MQELAIYYYPLYLLCVSIMTMNRYMTLDKYIGYEILTKREDTRIMLAFLLFFVLLYGFRPLGGFGDTGIYASIYEHMRDFGVYNSAGDEKAGSDWIFDIFMFTCAQVINVHFFLFIVMFFFIVPMYIGCKKIDFVHVSTMMLFCIGSYIFYGSAVNGIRNGMACSLVIWALASLCRGQLLWPIMLSIIAIGCHKSTALPVACMFFVRYFRNPKLMFLCWLGAIIISLSLGGFISSLISNLGFDQRMSDNFQVNSKGVADLDGLLIETRFRWDFLLYSSMPILLGWYAIFKRKVYNNTYLMLLGTYIYANAFWVLAIRAIYSNRIANLSWFLYPIVLAYPLLNLPVFEKKHSKKTAWILLAHFGFTFVMFLLGKS